MKIILQWGIVAVVLAAILTTGFQCSSAELTSAKLYLQRKDYANAQKQLEKEVDKNPKSEEGFFLLGQVRQELKDFTGMKEAFDKALAIAPTHQKEIHAMKLSVWGRLFNEGVDAINKTSDSSGNVDKAITLFTTATIVMPESIMTRRNLGLAYFRKNEIPNAIEHLTISFEQGKDLLACRLLGRIYLDHGAELRSKFTEAHREDFAAMKNLAYIHEKMKALDVKYMLGNPSDVSKPAKAKKGDLKEEWRYAQYNLTISVDGDVVTKVKYDNDKPYSPKIDSTLHFESVVQFNKAVDVMKKGQTMFPEDAEISENLMNAYIGAARNDEARGLLSERVRKYPQSRFDHYNFGVFLLKDTSFAKAIMQFRAASVDVQVGMPADDVEDLWGKPDEVINTVYEKINVKQYTYKLLSLYIYLSDKKVVGYTMKEEGKVIEVEHLTFSAIYNLAAAYVNWGVAEQERLKAAGKEGDVTYKEKYKMALPYLEKVVEEKKDDVQMLELLGQVYANLNMPDKALEAYETADLARKLKIGMAKPDLEQSLGMPDKMIDTVYENQNSTEYIYQSKGIHVYIRDAKVVGFTVIKEKK